MVRLHRSISRRLKKVNADDVANRTEDYMEAFNSYKKYLGDVRGLVTLNSLKSSVKRIDTYEKEIIKMEDRIESLIEKRNLAAARLEDDLEFNLDVVEKYLEPEELKDFR